MGGTLASFHNPSVDIPSTDEEFRDAIKALQASTEAIERQTRTINAQAAYLAKLKADDDAANQRRSTHASYLNQREAAEIQHVTFSNEQLLDNLRADVQSQTEAMAKDVKSVPSVVSQVLNADDRALAELNDLTTRRSRPPVNSSGNAQRLAQLTRALQHFRVQAVKDRLDCNYLQSINGRSSPEGDANPKGPAVSLTTVKEIQQDLGLLYEEIDDVVGMTVRHEHASRIEATLHQIDAAREMEGTAMAEQVHGRLASLTESLEQLLSRLEHLHIQRTTLCNLASRTESLQEQQSNPAPHPLARQTRAVGAASDTAATASIAQAALSRLLEHLSLQDKTTPNPQSPNQAPLHTAIRSQAHNLQSKSAEHISTILTASETAAANRQQILDAVARSLVSETSEKNTRELAELEAVVDNARLRMERRA